MGMPTKPYVQTVGTLAHMGPYVFFQNITFRVQTAPFDKITIDFCRSRRRLHDSDFILTQNPNI